MSQTTEEQQITTGSLHRTVACCPHVSWATRTLLILTVLGVFAAPALAETGACHRNLDGTGVTGGANVQVSGFKIEVKPVTDPNDSDSMVCHASVTSPKGEAVYSVDDWGAEIDPITGKDINGDGEPDAVLVSYSGGAHCCWTYHIIRLGKNPGLIAEFENQSSAEFKDLKTDGQYEIVIWDGSFDYGLGMAHAFSVFPRLIVQLRGNEFVDVSSDFWPKYRKEVEHARKEIDDKRLQAFRQYDPTSGEDDLKYLQAKHEILSTILDYVYGGKTDEAKSLLDHWWPKESQEQVWNEIMKGYCSGLRSQLGIANSPPCTDEPREGKSKKPRIKRQ